MKKTRDSPRKDKKQNKKDKEEEEKEKGTIYMPEIRVFKTIKPGLD